MRLRVDMEYGLRLGRQLQIFQHVFLFLLLLKLLQFGFPFLHQCNIIRTFYQLVMGSDLLF